MLKVFRKAAAFPTLLVVFACEVMDDGAANEVSTPAAVLLRLMVMAWPVAALDVVPVPAAVTVFGMSQLLPPVFRTIWLAPVSWPLLPNVMFAPVVGVSVGLPLRSGDVAVTFQLPLPAVVGVKVSTTVCCWPRLSNTWICCCTGVVERESRLPKASKPLVWLALLTVCGTVRFWRPLANCRLPLVSARM